MVENPLRLRPLEPADLSIRAAYLNTCFEEGTVALCEPVTLAGTNEWFERVCRNPDRSDFTVDAKGVSVGFAGLTRVAAAPKIKELYIFLGKEYRGRGFGQRATRALLEFGFDHLGLDRVFLWVSGGNSTACALYESVGFTREGRLRNHRLTRAGYEDRIVYGMLSSEWLARR